MRLKVTLSVGKIGEWKEGFSEEVYIPEGDFLDLDEVAQKALIKERADEAIMQMIDIGYEIIE